SGITITKTGEQTMFLAGNNSATLQGSFVVNSSMIEAQSANAFGTGTHIAGTTATTRGTLRSSAADSMSGAAIVLEADQGGGPGRLFANNANATGGSIFRGASVQLNGGLVELQNDNRNLVVGGDFLLNANT